MTTIETIGNTREGKALQKGWLDLEVVQCGYCQSGEIVSATALLLIRIRRMPTSTRDVGQHLPLRDLSPHSRGYSSRSGDMTGPA